MSAPYNFYDYDLDGLKALVVEHGLEKFRAEQLVRWVYGKGITDISQMTNIGKSAREKIAEIFKFEIPQIVFHRQSTDKTIKLLLDVGENQTVEAVLIPSENRLTLCVSSEIGCNMACTFCYTGKQKLKRRLTTAEIVGQYLRARQLLPPNERITNIVFMGMGEPLDNPDEVFRSIRVLHDPFGINLSLKKITVSTSGLVPQIPLVTASGTRLAVSLNGSNNDVRSLVMPVNKKWPIEELLSACRKHCKESGDRVTFEYVLLKGVTDSLEHARELHRITKSVPCKINIIPFNEHPGSSFQRPSESQVRRFQEELMALGVHVLRRKTMGRDIYAACGQLTSFFAGRPETFTPNQSYQ